MVLLGSFLTDCFCLQEEQLVDSADLVAAFDERQAELLRFTDDDAASRPSGPLPRMPRSHDRIVYLLGIYEGQEPTWCRATVKSACTYSGQSMFVMNGPRIRGNLRNLNDICIGWSRYRPQRVVSRAGRFGWRHLGAQV